MGVVSDTLINVSDLFEYPIEEGDDEVERIIDDFCHIVFHRNYKAINECLRIADAVMDTEDAIPFE